MDVKVCFSRRAVFGSFMAAGLFSAHFAGGVFGTGNTPPVIVQPAEWRQAAPTQVELTVVADDDGGESNLTYTWEVVGTPPAPVVEISPNGTNEAKITRATLQKAGTYSFKVTVRDAGGLTATSSVDAIVESLIGFWSILFVVPDTAIVPFSTSIHFTALITDQFGDTLNNNAHTAWTLLGDENTGATIDNNGLFTAGTVASTVTVRASALNSPRELLAFATAIVVPGGTVIPNLALNKPATASSCYGGYEPGKAVDGDTTTRWASRSETTPWLEIDFGRATTFDSVVINEGTWDRIRSYKIQYWNGSYWVTAFTGGNPANVQQDRFPAVTSNKVRFQVTSSTYEPTIWEFGVYKMARGNLVLNKPAAASSNYGGYEADNAVDANTSTRWASRSETTPWLEIDLGSNLTFDSVVINEGTWDRIRSYEIQYWNGSAWVTAFTGGNPANIQQDKFPAVTGSKVRLQVTSSIFDPTLWEFEVYRTDVQTPYNGPHDISAGATLECEDFDNGGEGVAYHDNDAANIGGQYRPAEGVDIEICSAGGYNVGWTNGNEWLEYTCNVTAGAYTITLYMATPYADAHPVTLYQDGALKATFTVANTGGWQTWVPVTANNVSLSAGVGSVLRLEIVNTGVNIDKIVFTPDTLTVQAEAYSAQSGCTVAALHAGYTGSGYLDYGGNGSYGEWNNVSCASAGTKTLRFRYANGSTGDRQCAVTVNGASAGTVGFSPTGAWSTWGTATITAPMNAGNNTVRLTANTSAGGPNLDTFEVTAR